MRDLLRLPALLLFLLVLLLLVLTGIDVLSTWGAGLSAGRHEALALAGARILPAVRDALPVTVLLSLVLLLFRITLKPGSRFLSFVIPVAVAFLVLAFGYRALDGLQARLGPPGTAVIAGGPSPGRYLVPERFNEAGGKVLYLSEVDDGTFSGVVLYDPEARAPRLRYASGGSVEMVEGGVRVRFGAASWGLAAEAVYAPLFVNDPVVRPLLEDISLLNLQLERLFVNSRPGFFLMCFALVFAFYTAGLFFRISRWPLLNVAIAFFVFRGYLYLARLLGHDMLGELGKVFRNPVTLAYLPALILLILGVLFFFIDVLFVPGDRWGRENA